LIARAQLRKRQRKLNQQVWGQNHELLSLDRG
jgi:hypothetical protein